MNTINNKKRRSSKEKIERAFVTLLQEKEIEKIYVTDIIKLAKVNRSTFYANYLDIYDLADKISDNMINEVKKIYKDENENNYNSNDFLKLFKHIYDNKLFYNTLFKLKVDEKIGKYLYDTNLSKELYNDEYIDYHIIFFKAGLNAIIKKWLSNDCIEFPEEINKILITEYQKNID